ncbi:hypothetical protein Dimus_024705 [Dionaea muscipula]
MKGTRLRVVHHQLRDSFLGHVSCPRVRSGAVLCPHGALSAVHMARRRGGRTSTARALLLLAWRRGGRTPARFPLKELSWPLHGLLACHTLAARLQCSLVKVLVPAWVCWPLVEATACSAPLPVRGGWWLLIEVAMLHYSPCSTAFHAPLLTMPNFSSLRCSPDHRPWSSLLAGCGVPLLASHGCGCQCEEGEHPELYYLRGTGARMPLAAHGDAPIYVASLGGFDSSS